jgi:anti-sigma B factor antagonist
MTQDQLTIQDLPGSREGQRILQLHGPLVMATLFDFQSKVRADHSKKLILDFSNVPYVDSAGIGSLVGAYVTRQKDGHALALVGVNSRVRTVLQVTHVESFFRFFDSVPQAEGSA